MYLNEPQQIRVKIYATSSKNFHADAYYGEGVYQNVFYSCIGWGRPSVTVQKETEEDEIGRQNILSQNITTEVNFAVFGHNNLVDFLSHVELHDVINLEIMGTGEVLGLTNVRAEDSGDRAEQLESITFFAQLTPAVAACGGGYQLV